MASSVKRYLAPAREKNFPNLTKNLYEVVDDETDAYNCIAFAAGDKTRWWEPDPYGVYYWPIPRREYTVSCYVELFESLGYKKCKCSIRWRGIERVALYYDPVGSPQMPPNSPTHAAKQFPNGRWRSKLGAWELIEHKGLTCLNGTDATGSRTSYGEPFQLFKRPI